MSVKIKLPNGTVIECDTPEEASRFVKAQQGPDTSSSGSSSGVRSAEEAGDGPLCGGCGYHHFGMC